MQPSTADPVAQHTTRPSLDVMYAVQPTAGTADDDLLAAVLIRMWALASGRPLPRDVPPDELTAEELIAFWADDFSTVSGRHAVCGPAAAGGRKWP
jgi:hypothetical protein